MHIFQAQDLGEVLEHLISFASTSVQLSKSIRAVTTIHPENQTIMDSLPGREVNVIQKKRWLSQWTTCLFLA